MRNVIRDVIAVERQTKVAALRLQGLTLLEIAERLGNPTAAGQQQVFRDLKKVQNQWRESAVRDFDAHKSEQLAKLQNLERELWQAWERSKLDRHHFAETYVRKGNEGVTASTKIRTMVQNQSRDGNPAFTGQILTCIRDQSELLGIVAKPGEVSTSPPLVGFRIYRPDGSPPLPTPPPPASEAEGEAEDNSEATQAS